MKHSESIEPHENSETYQEHLTQLLTLSQTLNSSLKLDEVLNMAMEMVVDFLNAERGFIMLYSNDGKLELKAHKNVEAVAIQNFESISKTILNASALEGKNVISVDAQRDPRFKNLDSVMLSGMRSVMCVPLKAKKKIIGVVYVDNRIETGMFKEGHLKLLSAFSNQAAVAIENARLYENLISSYDERIKLTQELHQQEKIRIASEEANKAKSEFVSIVSHELRSPLTVIKNYSTILYKDAVMGRNSLTQVSKMEIYKTVDREVDRLITMINKLLDVSRIDAGKQMVLEKRYSNVRELVDLALKMQKTSKFYQDSHNIIVNLPEKLPCLFCDPGKLSQVITNLLENALKYSPDGGDVTFSIDTDEDYMNFSVKDSGLGISKENQKRLFKKYERIEESNIRTVPGTGLGLYLIKHLIDLHRGKISVESEPGVGSTFKFSLPIKPTLKELEEMNGNGKLAEIVTPGECREE